VDAAGDRASTTINVNVGTPSFTLSANPTAVSVNAGSPTGTTSQIIVMPTSVFSDAVNLSGSVPGYPGIVISFTPQSAVIGENGHGKTCLATITAASSVPPTTYTATITGTVGGVTATTTLAIMVNPNAATVLSVGDGTWSSDPQVDVPFTGTVTSSFNPALLPTDTVSYVWATGQVWRAPDNGDASSLHFSPYTGSPPTWPEDSTAGTPTFDADFSEPGYYIIQVSVVATILHGDKTTTVVNGAGLIGGTASDIDSGAAVVDVLNESSVSGAMDVPAPYNLYLPPTEVGGHIMLTYNGFPSNIAYADVTGKMNTVQEGKYIAMTAIGLNGAPITGGHWSFSDSGAPAASWHWSKPFGGMDCKPVIDPEPQVINAPGVAFAFTKPGVDIPVTYTAPGVSLTTYFRFLSPLWPRKPDTTIFIQTFYTDSTVTPTMVHPLAHFSIAIPSAAQIQYPFTRAPDIMANARSAKTWGVIVAAYSSYTFWVDYLPNRSIGDWGKGTNLYPDLNYNPTIDVLARRRGANFNLGVMGAAAGWDLQILLDFAKIINPNHPPLEQDSISAGYWWYMGGGVMPTSSITVDIKSRDKRVQTPVLHGGST
jgi:hypothetical protein